MLAPATSPSFSTTRSKGTISNMRFSSILCHALGAPVKDRFFVMQIPCCGPLGSWEPPARAHFALGEGSQGGRRPLGREGCSITRIARGNRTQGTKQRCFFCWRSVQPTARLQCSLSSSVTRPSAPPTPSPISVADLSPHPHRLPHHPPHRPHPPNHPRPHHLPYHSPCSQGVTTAYRRINGESDGFPGLVVDRYGDTDVAKVYTAAWLPHLGSVLPAACQGAGRVVLRLSDNAKEAAAAWGVGDGDVVAGEPLGEDGTVSGWAPAFERRGGGAREAKEATG